MTDCKLRSRLGIASKIRSLSAGGKRESSVLKSISPIKLQYLVVSQLSHISQTGDLQDLNAQTSGIAVEIA